MILAGYIPYTLCFVIFPNTGRLGLYRLFAV